MSGAMFAGPAAAAAGVSFTGAIPAELFRRRPRLDLDAPVIDNIAKVIGAGATARLIAAHGGRRVYIAKCPGPGDPVVQVIGRQPALKLGAIFGGERVWLPNAAGHISRSRIARMRRGGSSVSRIARQLNCSERYVYKVLAQLRNE